MIKVLLLTVLTALLLCSAVCAINFPSDCFEGKETFPLGKAEIIKEFKPGNSVWVQRCVFNGNHTPICLGGKRYLRGIGVHADCHLKFTFNEPVVRFVSDAGVDSAAFGRPSQDVCTVIADSREMYKSEVMQADNSFVSLDMPLDNITVLELKVERPDKKFNSDWFSWGDTRVITESGKTVYLDTLISKAKLTQGVPFSFTYGSKSSRELLPGLPMTAEKNGNITTYTWNTEDGLEIKADMTQYEEGAEWTVRYTNRGTGNSQILSNLSALDLNIENVADAPIAPETLPGETGKFLTPEGTGENNIAVMTMAGSKGLYGFNWDEFKLDVQLLETDSPITVHHGQLAPTIKNESPYYTVKWPEGGIVFGLGWTGPWQADISRQGNNLHIQAGRDLVNTYLKPGESIRSARVLTAYYEGPDMHTGFNAWRRTMIKHIIPHTQSGEPEFIPISYYVSWKETNAATEQNDREYLKYLRHLDFDTAWFDAWFHRNGFPKGMGNYHYPVTDLADPVRYPHGIKPISNLVHDMGKKMLMWYAPEAVMPDTYVAREHPEWVMKAEGDDTGSFALVNPEARAWMVDFLCSCFREWNINYFRTDYFTLREHLLAYVGENAPDRQGIADNMFCEALYAFWDALLERNPGLVIDNCGGGGTRLDLELMSRSFSMWRSDSNVGITDPNRIDILAQYFTSNLNYYIPWTTGSCFGYTPYDFRSCFNGGLDFKRPIPLTNEDFVTINKGIAECRRLQKYCLGDFYSLYNPGYYYQEWCIWQYNRPEEGDGCMLAFRRPESGVFGRNVSLKAIEEDARYQVEIYETFDIKEKRIMKGSELKNIRLQIDEAPGSILIEYKKVK